MSKAQWLTSDERFERWVSIAALLAFGWCTSPIAGLLTWCFIGGVYGAVMAVHFSGIIVARRRRVARQIIDRRMGQVVAGNWTLRACVAEMDRVIDGAYGVRSASRIRTRTGGSKARRAANYTKADEGGMA